MIHEFFQDDAESQGIGSDVIFFDSTDIWLPDSNHDVIDAPATKTTPSTPDGDVTPTRRSPVQVNGNGSKHSSLATLSSEDALPSVSVSVGLKSSLKTVEM